MKLYEAIFGDSIKPSAIEEIMADVWDTDVSHFMNSLRKSKKPEYLSDFSEKDFGNMRVFKLPNYDIGFALDGDEIVAVHNNESGVHGIGDLLIQSAVKHGGKRLSHFDGYLSDFYEKNGFVEYRREPYDPSLVKTQLANKPDVIWRVHKDTR
jgi:hypothetical protein